MRVAIEIPMSKRYPISIAFPIRMPAIHGRMVPPILPIADKMLTALPLSFGKAVLVKATVVGITVPYEKLIQIRQTMDGISIPRNMSRNMVPMRLPPNAIRSM